MKRLPSVALALAVSAVVTVCIAQQPKPSAPRTPAFTFETPRLPADVPAEAAATGESADAVEAIDPEALRTQLLDLIKQKLDMMDDAELQSAFTAEQRELNERHATRKLDQVRQALKAVADEYPQTRAGRQATSILSMWDSAGTHHPI